MIIPLLENVVRKIRRSLYIKTPEPVREQMRIGRLTFNYDLLWQDVPTRNKHLKSTGYGAQDVRRPKRVCHRN